MTNIVYQAYGRKDIIYQTVFSILSLIETSKIKDLRVIIYTDDIDCLKKFFASYDFVHYELLTKEQMTIWKGPHNFHHRMKIEILKDCSKKYDGNILYLDGDTYFVSDIENIFKRITENQSVMHISEGNVKKSKDPLTKKIHKFLKENKISVNGKEVKVSDDYAMWNAGAIGLHRKHHAIFQDIIDYTDELFGRYPKHIMEQHAASYYMLQTASVVPCDDILEHYWNQKDSFEEVIIPFFEKNQDLESYKKNKDQLKLPKRHHGRPRQTFKQKVKRKITSFKQKLGLIEKP